MCGIAGWFGSRDAPQDLARAMGSSLWHRGPDDSGELLGPSGGLVFRRLALLDLTRGNQPCSDERGQVHAIFNGEIYNHAELRQELLAAGHVLHGHGDAELIPHLYEVHGPEFLHRLRGMFAIAVQDDRSGELFLARDRFGIKPLYYAEDRQGLLFASEISALRQAGVVGREPDPNALWHFLGFGYVPDPLTMWPGVSMLPAGHQLLVNNRGVQLRQWWAPTFSPDETMTEREAVSRINDAISDSVRVHLDADVPVGAYLSSGVDSSLLVALGAQCQNLQTFSIGFTGSSAQNQEVHAAAELARRLGTAHHEVRISEAEYWENLPNIIAAQEEPLADPSAPALWFLARAAAPHVKAVLSGEGADELFAGYPIFQQPHALRAVTGLPPLARRAAQALGARLPHGRRGKGYLERGSTPLPQRFLGSAPLFGQQAQRRLMPALAHQSRSSASLLAASYARSAHQDDVAQMQLASMQTWLPSSILMKADKMAMAHSLEVRVPYLDNRVFDVARQLPLPLRVNATSTKLALRAAAQEHLPAATAQRPKLGFPVPFRSWLDGAMGARVGELFGDCNDPLLDRAAVMTVLDEQRSPDRQQQVWALMTYLLWRQAQVLPPVR